MQRVGLRRLIERWDVKVPRPGPPVDPLVKAREKLRGRITPVADAVALKVAPRFFVSPERVPYTNCCELFSRTLVRDLPKDLGAVEIDHHNIVIRTHHLAELRYRGRFWVADGTWQQFVPAKNRKVELPKLMLATIEEASDPDFWIALGVETHFAGLWRGAIDKSPYRRASVRSPPAATAASL